MTSVKLVVDVCAESVQNTVRLGSSDLHVSRLGLGSLQWGDTQQGYGSRFNEVGKQLLKPTLLDIGVFV